MEKVRELLTPTDDEAWWYRRVMALDSEAVTPLLIDVLADRKETFLTRKMALMILGLVGDRRAAEPLLRTLGAPDPVMRAQAAKALARFAEPGTGAVEALTHGLADEVYFVRASCARALGRSGAREAVARLEEMSSADPVETNQEIARKAIEDIERSEPNRASIRRRGEGAG